MSEPVTPNEDALFDPAFARAEAQRIYGEHLATIAEVREYGCNLLRSIPATSGHHVLDFVLVAGLLRQAMVGLDGWLVLASEGAAQAARTEARVVWEAALYQRWVLTMGRVRWARQLYVASLRRGRQTARRIMKDAEEHRQYEAAWAAWRRAAAVGATGLTSAEAPGQASDRGAQELLESSLYDSMNRDFELELSKTGREPEWHSPGVDGVPSIRAMAERLGALPDYLVLYGTLSDATHGTAADLHFRLEGGSPVALEPIRNASLLDKDMQVMVPALVRMLADLTAAYRPDELGVLQERVRAWQPHFET